MSSVSLTQSDIAYNLTEDGIFHKFIFFLRHSKEKNLRGSFLCSKMYILEMKELK